MGNDDISLAWEEPDELGSLVDAWSAKVEDLRPLIEGAKVDAEQWRKLPQHIADALRDAGFYRVFTPRSLGFGLNCQSQ